LADFVRAQRFDHVGVFTYSHEEGTSAYGYDDDVPATGKTGRKRRIMNLQKQLITERNRTRVGQRARAIVDGPADHELVLRARLASQAPDIDASVYLTDCDPSTYRAGDLVTVEIVGAKEYDLIARPIGSGPGMREGSAAEKIGRASCRERV